MRILVVDNDLLALRYVRDALSKAGFTPVVTGDPQEALALMYEKKPHLVLLDFMLPGIDGIEGSSFQKSQIRFRCFHAQALVGRVGGIRLGQS